MSIDIPLYSKSVFDSLKGTGPGKYRLYLKDVNFSLFPNWQTGYTATVSGNIVTIITRTDQREAKTMQLVVESKPDPAYVNESNVAWGAVAIFVMIGGILVAGAFTIDKIEKIVDSPGGQVALVGGGLLIVVVVLLGLYAVYKYVSKKK
jgi:hypothetical protein